MRKWKADKPWMGPLPAAVGCDCHVCRPERSYDDMDRQTIDSVLQHGWQVMYVSDDGFCPCPDHSDVPDHDVVDALPAFAYTIGLTHRFGHPELLMSGLDRGLMHRALNNVAERVMAGRRLSPGDVLENVLGRVPVVLEQVSDEGLRETVTWSGWFHRRKPEALAIVWPSTSGLFAWQPGAPAVLDERQPPAWRVSIEHIGALGIDPPWPFPVPPDQLVFSCTHMVQEGAPALWVVRQSGGSQDEDWTVHCGDGHDVEQMKLVHFAHVVRSAPSVRDVSGLGLDEVARRADVSSPWVTSAVPADLD